MTAGALIFAFNNEKTDYVAMAEWSARNIRRHLDIPVAIVTDCTDTDRTRTFDRVISAVPDAGVEKVFALIVKAETLPVEAPVKSITPVEVSIPNTFSNPFTQF
jgi:hypothetical protein